MRFSARGRSETSGVECDSLAPHRDGLTENSASGGSGRPEGASECELSHRNSRGRIEQAVGESTTDRAKRGKEVDSPGRNRTGDSCRGWMLLNMGLILR